MAPRVARRMKSVHACLAQGHQDSQAAQGPRVLRGVSAADPPEAMAPHPARSRRLVFGSVADTVLREAVG